MRQVTTRQFRGCARRLREHPMTDKRRLAHLRPLLSRGIVIAGLGACPSNRQILLAKEGRVRFCLCA